MSTQPWTTNKVKEILQVIDSTVRRCACYDPDFEEIKQEAFIKVFLNKDKLPAPPELWRSYVNTTARNATYDYFRSHGYSRSKINKMVTVEDAPSADDDAYSRSNVEASYSSAISYTPEFPDPFMSAAVDNALANLTDSHRAVLVLESEGLLYDEMATKLQISVGTVRSRLYYARKYARKSLEQLV